MKATNEELMLGQSTHFNLRRAVPGDAIDIAKINVEAWRSTYKDIVDSKFLASLSYEKNLSTALKRIENDESDCIVAVNKYNQSLAGFIQIGPCREKNSDADGEIYALYLSKNFIGQGVGKLLFGSAIAILKERNYKKVMVSVFEKNDLGRNFYERMGGREDRPDRVVLDGISYPTATYTWAL